MMGDQIPDPGHVARFCKPVTVHDGQIQSTAFMLRKGEEYLSVNWLEILNCQNRETEIAQIRTIYSGIFNVKPRARLAILKVGEIREKVMTETPDNRNLNVLHNPSSSNQSHSGIYNLKYDDEFIAELIIEIIRESYPACN